MGTFEFLQLLFAFAAANILCGLVIYAVFIIIDMVFESIYTKYVNYKKQMRRNKEDEQW